MTSSTINLPQLLADLDALRIEALPLEEHSLARFDTHVREAYATQLATLMLIENIPSDNQARLFNQLLDALKLGSDASPRLLQLAQQTNQQSLREFLKLVEEHRLEASFIVDGLVLCRLDAPLSETQSQVFSEYTQLMQVQESDLARYAHLAAQVLGLPSDYELPTNFDFNGYKLRVWKEFFYRELTQEMLDEGVDLNHGLWVIKKALTANSFNLSDGFIRWQGEQAHLTVSDNFNLKNCWVENPYVEASGRASIVLDNCNIKGRKSLDRQITAFTLGQGSIEIDECSIKFKNMLFFQKRGGYDPVKISVPIEFLNVFSKKSSVKKINIYNSKIVAEPSVVELEYSDIKRFIITLPENHVDAWYSPLAVIKEEEMKYWLDQAKGNENIKIEVELR